MCQIFRNDVFHKFCSYDLEELIVHPFNYLYRRDPEIDKLLSARVIDCFTTIETIERIGTETHIMQENFLKHSEVFEINHKWVAPLFSIHDESKRLAFVSTQTADRRGRSNVHGIGFVN